MMPVALCIPFPFSTPCDAMLTMLVCATSWLYIHLYTLAYMSIHESFLLVCRPYFNTMKLWTFDPTYICPLQTPSFVCFLTCFPICLLVSFLAFDTFCACHIYLACSLYILLLLFTHFSFYCLSVGFLYLPFHVRTRSEDAQSQGTVSQEQAKGARMRACQHEPSRSCSQLVQGLAFFLWLCTLLTPLIPPPFSPLNGLYYVFHALYHSSSSLEYGDPCLFSCTYILGHTLAMQAFTFLLCVLALCMMHVYIYIYILACPFPMCLS